MLLGRQAVAFVLQHLQRFDDPHPGVGRVDHIVKVPAARGDVGRGELLLIVPNQLLAFFVLVLGLGYLFPVDYVNGALDAHDRDLR